MGTPLGTVTINSGGGFVHDWNPSHDRGHHLFGHVFAHCFSVGSGHALDHGDLQPGSRLVVSPCK